MTSHRDILCDTSGYARFPREPVADLHSLQRMTVGNLSGVAAKRPETEVYAGVLVTDNVFTDKSNVDVTLEQAEATIAETADLRKEFLLKVLRKKGHLERRHPAGSNSGRRTAPIRHVRPLKRDWFETSRSRLFIAPDSVPFYQRSKK
jgi:hypothetical protein